MILTAGSAFAHPPVAAPDNPAPFGPPIDDGRIWVHGVLDQFEARLGNGDTSLRWDAEAWAGPDEWRFWLKSEGELTHGQVSDGQIELLVSKPITPWFDIQVGGRYDLDSDPGRGWAVLGLEGLLAGFVRLAATAYVGEGFAGKVKVSYDQLITNRLILAPEAEINLYSQDDPARLIGSGLSDLDAGLRLRYEIARKFAPYIGVTWEQKFGETADLVRAAGEPVSNVRLTLGVRAWF
jgi:copper resistance protein B